MNYNTLRNKPTINYRELIGDSTVSEVGGVTEEEFNDLLDTDLASYYTKAQIDELFARSYVFREKSGSIVTFDCPSSVNGIDKVVNEIVAVQSGTGDPSPTNIRPISGWSAVNVTRASENLFNGEYPYIDSTTRKLTLDVGEGSFTMTSTIPVYDNGGINVANIFLQTGTGDTTASSDLDGVWAGHPITVNSTDGKVTIKYRIFENRAVCDPRRYETWLRRQATYTTTLKDGQGNPLVCYGGELSNENGVQSLDNAHNSFDMGSIGWGYTNNRFYAKIDDIWKNEQGIVPTENQLMCEIYKTVMYTNQPSGTVSTWSEYIYVRDDSYSGDVTAFKTAVTGYKITYELATPQTISQDNLAISSSAGTNNIWCNSGDITVKALDRIIQG